MGDDQTAPVQVWVPDVRSDEFAAEAHRQSRLVADADARQDDQAFVEAITASGTSETRWHRTAQLRHGRQDHHHPPHQRDRTMRRTNATERVGRLQTSRMVELERRIAVFLGLAG